MMEQDLFQETSPAHDDRIAPALTPIGREESAPFAGLTYFTLDHARILAAAAARLIPSDETGPGAAEAGVVYFIDRQLGTGVGYRGRRYGLGPFHAGESTQGAGKSGARIACGVIANPIGTPTARTPDA